MRYRGISALFSNVSCMDCVWNKVTIEAPLEEVKTYLYEAPKGDHRFNLHLLFPERFAVDDPSGERDYDRLWMLTHLDVSWSPTVELMEDHGEYCLLGFETPIHACASLLRQLHLKTGWRIVDDYVADFGQFSGQVLCENGSMNDDFGPEGPGTDWDYGPESDLEASTPEYVFDSEDEAEDEPF